MAICYINTSLENEVPMFGVVTMKYMVVDNDGTPTPILRCTQTYNNLKAEVSKYGIPRFIMLADAPAAVKSAFNNKLYAMVSAFTMNDEAHSVTITSADGGSDLVASGTPIDEAGSDYYLDYSLS